jgi:hypothetical protein
MGIYRKRIISGYEVHYHELLYGGEHSIFPGIVKGQIFHLNALFSY